MINQIVSIIVPVYNVQQYLGDCVNSLLNQSYVHTEIILVNDGSTDDSGEICDKYAKEYPHKIKVVHKNNEGLNYARRDGFLASSGELVTFVDSDDVISSNFIDVLKSRIDKYEADVAVTGFFSFDNDADVNLSAVTEIEDNFEDNKNILMGWLIEGGAPWGENMYIMTAWGKLYRREVVGKIDWNFSNYRANEDEFWSLQAFNYTQRGMVITKSKLYGYRQNQDSITRKIYKNEYNDQSMDKFVFIGHLYEKSLDFLGLNYNIPLVRRLGINTVDFIDIYTDKGDMNFNNMISAQKIITRYARLILSNQPSARVAKKIKRMRRLGVIGYVIHRRSKKIFSK